MIFCVRWTTSHDSSTRPFVDATRPSPYLVHATRDAQLVRQTTATRAAHGALHSVSWLVRRLAQLLPTNIVNVVFVVAAVRDAGVTAYLRAAGPFASGEQQLLCVGPVCGRPQHLPVE